MTPRLFLATLLVLIGTGTLSAQSSNLTTDHCGSAVLHEQLLTDPATRQRMDRFNDRWSKAAKSGFPLTTKRNTLTIPVVFQVVHQNGAERLSEAELRAGLDHLNDAFANQNYYDDGNGVATDIEFCLATRSPENQPTNGVVYLESPFTTLEISDNEEIMRFGWEQRDYLNIYTVRELCGLGFGCGLGGVASFPSSAGNFRDGIILESRFVGDNPEDISVLVHEIGHYLGLYHTFTGGCGNSNCNTSGDRICDTPPDDTQNGSPCDDPLNSCSTDAESGFDSDQPDQVWNYMDYGQRSCARGFTALQRERMRLALTEEREELLESFGCSGLCPALVTVDFSPPADTTVSNGYTVLHAPVTENADWFEWIRNGSIVSTESTYLAGHGGDRIDRMRLRVGSNLDYCGTVEFRWRVSARCSRDQSFEIVSELPLTPGDTIELEAANDQYFTTWFLNGDSVGVGTSASFLISERGQHEICTDRSEWNCIRRECKRIFLADTLYSPEFPAECQSPFSLSLVNNFWADRFTALAHSGNTYYVATTFERDPVIVSFLPNGYVNWQVALSVNSSYRYLVKELSIDQDGMLYGVAGRDRSSNFIDETLVFRINSENGEVQWTRKYDDAGRAVIFNSITSPNNSESYVLVGAGRGGGESVTSRSGFITTISKVDGTISTPINSYIGILQEKAAYLYAESGITYSLGESSRELGSLPIVSAINERGEIIWRKLLGDARGNYQHLVGHDIVADSSGVTVIGELWNLNSDPIEGTFIATISLSGDSLSTKFFSVPSLTASQAMLTIRENGLKEIYYPYNSLVKFAQISNQSVQLFGSLNMTELIANSPSDVIEAVPGGIAIISRLPSTLGGEYAISKIDDGVSTFCTNRYLFGTESILDTVFLELRTINAEAQEVSHFSTSISSGPAYFVTGSNSCLARCDEICDNNIDDDFDGLTDCDDPNLANDCCCLNQTPEPAWRDTTICAGQQLEITPAGRYTTHNWSTGSDSSVLVVTESGHYRLEATDDCGNVFTDSLTVTVRPLLQLDLGPDTALCVGVPLELTASAGFTDYRWSDNSTGPTTTFTGPGTYWIAATDSCGTVFRDTLTATEGRTAAITLQTYPETCAGDRNGLLLVSSPTEGLRYRLDGSSPQTVPEFTNLAPGSYQLTVFDSLGCDEVFPVTIAAGGTPTAELPDRTLVRLGEPLTLRGRSNRPEREWRWTSSYSDSCRACPDFTLEPSTDGWVELTVENETGCAATDRTEIVVVEGNLLYLPSAFSPNNDGINDVWQPLPGPAVADIETIQIYDRFGGEAFRGGGADAWDGGQLPRRSLRVLRSRHPQKRPFGGAERGTPAVAVASMLLNVP